MRSEYDFSKGTRGKYAARYAKGSNIIVLDPELAKLFPDSKAVNDALRALADVADRQTRRRRRPGVCGKAA
jgi:hypothetical protein